MARDKTSIDLHMTAGRGPAECAYAVARLVAVLEAEAVALGIGCQSLETTPSGKAVPRGLLSAVIRLSGEGALELAARLNHALVWRNGKPAST